MLAGVALGLVLGGGAALGFAHVGVIRALDEAGTAVDWVGGSSIGAVFAAGCALDWPPDRIAALARQAFVDENPLGDLTIPVVSLLRGRRLRSLVRRYFGANLKASLTASGWPRGSLPPVSLRGHRTAPDLRRAPQARAGRRVEGTSPPTPSSRAT